MEAVTQCIGAEYNESMDDSYFVLTTLLSESVQLSTESGKVRKTIQIRIGSAVNGRARSNVDITIYKSYYMNTNSILMRSWRPAHA
jgi:hypothetical protein